MCYISLLLYQETYHECLTLTPYFCARKNTSNTQEYNILFQLFFICFLFFFGGPQAPECCFVVVVAEFVPVLVWWILMIFFSVLHDVKQNRRFDFNKSDLEFHVFLIDFEPLSELGFLELPVQRKHSNFELHSIEHHSGVVVLTANG